MWIGVGRNEKGLERMLCSLILLNYRKITTGPTASSGAKGTNFLGRPLGNFSQTVFQNSDLGGVIAPEGWEGSSQLLSLILVFLSFQYCQYMV